jgi:hypothetical protein
MAMKGNFSFQWHIQNGYQPVCSSFKLLIFSQPTVFFSHNKPSNSTFNRLFSAKQNKRLKV